jgi:hypothetical protein
MSIKLSYIAPLLAAGAAAAAIAAAPIAAADPGAVQQSCTESVSGSECQSPGNVQITDTPGPMNYDPYGDDGFLLGGFGGYGGGFGHGGGFGGGHGGGGHGGR